MGLKSFFKETALQPQNIKFVLSGRFTDENGKPELWELRALTEKENVALKEQCTKKTVGKGGRAVAHFDGELYIKSLAAKSVVYPDLANAELQGSYGVVGEVELINMMLLPGESTILQDKAREVNGYDDEKLLAAVNEVKNS